MPDIISIPSALGLPKAPVGPSIVTTIVSYQDNSLVKLSRLKKETQLQVLTDESITYEKNHRELLKSYLLVKPIFLDQI